MSVDALSPGERFSVPRSVSWSWLTRGCTSVSRYGYLVVNQLADLFWNMEFCDVPAVTPTIDLAKLALVTSQDEEEEDQEKTGTDASNDTDATLVEDAPPRTYERSSQSPVQSPTFSSPGKRNRLHKQSSQMDIDSILDADKEKEGYVLVSKPSSPRASGSPAPPEASGSNSKQKTVDQDGDIEMRDVSTTKPPPLPPRKPRDVDDSVMMFGKLLASDPVLCYL